MCRMLVDCDNCSSVNKVKTEEWSNTTSTGGKGKESKPLVEVPDGTVVMGKCWGAIVYSEVAQVLSRLAESYSPYRAVVEVVKLYNQLKQAMLELFGGHSHFALAMKEGFSKAFQGLDEVEGVKVCGCAEFAITSALILVLSVLLQVCNNYTVDPFLGISLQGPVYYILSYILCLYRNCS